MRTESDAYARESDILRRDLWEDGRESDGQPSADGPQEDERLEITGLRSPITINHNYPQPAGSSADQSPPVPDSPPAQEPPPAPAENSMAKNSAWKTWLKRAAIAALPLAGVGGKMAYDAATLAPAEQPARPTVVQPAAPGSYLQYHLDVLPPAEDNPQP